MPRIDTDALAPLILLAGDVGDNPFAYEFVHQYGGVFCRHVTMTGFALRLIDNLDRLPPTGGVLATVLEDGTWDPVRTEMGNDAHLRWRMDQGRCVEELFEATESFEEKLEGLYEGLDHPTTPEAARRWTRMLQANLGAFPPVASAREALVVSIPFDPGSLFGAWRVTTAPDPREQTTAVGPLLADAIRRPAETKASTNGAPYRAAQSLDVGVAMRACFLWQNSD